MTLISLYSVELSLTDLCSRTCSFCPRHDASIYPNRNLNMSIDTVTRIRDQLHINNYKENNDKNKFMVSKTWIIHWEYLRNCIGIIRI